MNNIRRLMRDEFAKLDGGLFSASDKADVGDVYDQMIAKGVAMMSWADPFAPDHVLPDCVKEEMLKSIDKGIAEHYTMPIGSGELKKALCERIEHMYGLKLDPTRNIMINPGSDVGLYLAMSPWLNKDDEVLVLDPSYASNFLNPSLIGARLVRVKTYEEDGYHVREEEIRKVLSNHTKMLLLTNPNNPTGTSYNKEEMTMMANICIEKDLICVVDQAFEDTCFNETAMVSMANIPGMWERTVTVGSASKGMALSGMRVGWLYCDDVIMDVYHACAVNLQGAPNSLSQFAVIPAIKDDSFIKNYIDKYDKRRKYAYKIFNQIPGVKMAMPKATFLLWLDVSKLGSSNEVSSYLIEEAKVNVNAGINYGLSGEGHLRIVAGCYENDEVCFSKLDDIANALKKMADRKGIK